ncbi:MULTISPECIES: helicase HerA-like C-terminal domain-containing protein [Pandoraea]|uniref:helicase HerA-like C-terminal domain-containing protein n=2 Tax=Pandoraea TaxID=93217 RepID=UPI002413F04C|nr:MULTISPECIES: helicase HerA-like C-terminal domain-containing protein [Pandoraea]MCI3205296.1 ATP-binding protein [Pandoraea sp. LA3]MDN4583324.1 ATP-binding protein [Pandoraea capi]
MPKKPVPSQVPSAPAPAATDVDSPAAASASSAHDAGERLTIARNAQHVLGLLPAMGNRHGLITGATGTGKTVTLQVIAQAFSDIGVPVFLADVKGDLTGITQPGVETPKLKERIANLGFDTPDWHGSPATLWDVFGEQGHPVRATISDLGPLLLARLLGLNETQTGVLNLVFKIADDNGLLLLDSKDLRAMLQHVGDNASNFTTQYGNISAASVGAIQRGLLTLEQQGADKFFGEPMLNIEDFMQTDAQGRGVVNILAADKLLAAPRIYATFLLWLLAELFERLPEVGDPDKPKLVFFFDEAHLLFNEAPKPLLERIEQMVRLIRSKGVGVYFVTQNPVDVPDTVLGQLGNRVQHALRAYSPRDQKAVKVAAQTMRANPSLDIETVIGELGVGEALVSLLDEKGRPEITERAYIAPPASRIGPITPQERTALMAASLVAGVYEKVVDRESAYEKLVGRTQARQPDGTPVPAGNGGSGSAPSAGGGGLLDSLGGLLGGSGGSRSKDSPVEAMVKSTMRTVGSQLGREIVRGVLGSIFGGSKRR